MKETEETEMQTIETLSRAMEAVREAYGEIDLQAVEAAIRCGEPELAGTLLAEVLDRLDGSRIQDWC